VEIELEGTGLTYQTADNLAVMPENDPAAVAELVKAQGYVLDESFYVEPVDAADAKYDFPSPCTVKDVLSRFYDLHGALKQNTLKQLVPYVADGQQKDWLKALLADDNRAAFKKTFQEGGRSICDLLVNGGELSSCKVPLADLLHILPFMQPRYYTISSSSSCHPNTVHITVSVTEFAANGRKLKGLCSSYLQQLMPGASSSTRAAACRVFVRPSSFRLPKLLSTPIVMIGPGTGIAPMRALLQDRKWQADNNGTTGKNTLYFGCQKRTVDYIYKDEIEEYAATKVLTSLQLAFSRESEKKVYVQHLIRASDNAKDIVIDLDQGGYIFVCGATAMGTDVMDAVVDVVASQKGLTKEAATEYVRDLQKKGRYVQELWTA
jgi:NADPH-ferrihemoprotein reductase